MPGGGDVLVVLALDRGHHPVRRRPEAHQLGFGGQPAPGTDVPDDQSVEGGRSRFRRALAGAVHGRAAPTSQISELELSGDYSHSRPSRLGRPKHAPTSAPSPVHPETPSQPDYHPIKLTTHPTCSNSNHRTKHSPRPLNHHNDHTRSEHSTIGHDHRARTIARPIPSSCGGASSPHARAQRRMVCAAPSAVGADVPSRAGGAGAYVHPLALGAEQAEELHRLRSGVGEAVRGAGVELGRLARGEHQVVLAQGQP